MRIALAYSGDLKGSAAIQWLRDAHGADVVAVMVDLGQGTELHATRERALALGARRAHVIDARERFAASFILPALRADACHETGVPMAEALSRPLIAQILVEIAAIERADAVAHTSISAGPAPYRSRLDALLDSLRGVPPVLAPHREWTLTPEALASFARTHGLSATSDTRSDVNLWGATSPLAATSGSLAATARHTPAPPSECAHVDITFERGVPVAVNGVTMPMLEIVTSLATFGTMYGVGSTTAESIESQAPAAVLLHLAHRELVRALSAQDVQRFSAEATRAYVTLVEHSAWFSTLRQALDEYFTATHVELSGRVRLHLHRGSASLVAVEALSAAKTKNQPSPSRQGLS